MDTAKAKIRSFLSRFMRNHNLEDDEDLFAMGLVNSLFAMQLVLYVEKEFNIKVENEDLDYGNFKSANAICSLVERKTSFPTSAVD